MDTRLSEFIAFVTVGVICFKWGMNYSDFRFMKQINELRKQIKP